MADEIDGLFIEGDDLTPDEQIEKLAQDGDFQGVWRVLTDTTWDMLDQDECFRLLLQAAEVAARNDPRQFANAVFTKILSFSSYLLLRTHFQLGAILKRHDAGMRKAGDLPVPRGVVEALPALLELQ
jgi:hypothetical protein